MVLAADAAGFAAGLEAVAAGEPAAGVIAGPGAGRRRGEGRVRVPGPGRPVGGDGGRAGRRRARCSPGGWRSAWRRLQPLVDWPVARGAGGRPMSGRLERADVVQPLLWAVMVALAAAWESLGVTPDAVAGHSQGEIAAAHGGRGSCRWRTRARVVAVRSRALAGLPGGRRDGGGRLACGGSRRTRWPGRSGRVWVAAVNGPVVGGAGRGPRGAGRGGGGPGLARPAGCGRGGCRWITPRTARRSTRWPASWHGSWPGWRPEPGRVPFWSAVTGEPLTRAGLDGGYWVANLREPVRFEQVVRGLAGAGHGVFVEVSPASGAGDRGGADAGREQPGCRDAVVAGTLRRGDGGAGPAAGLGGGAVRPRGARWTGRRCSPGRGRGGWTLPTYAFQRQRYWPTPRPRLALPVAGGDGAEAGFWAAVERQDLAGWRGRWGSAGDEPLSAVLPALAAWRRRRREESAVDRWRYQVTWVPVTGLGRRRGAGRAVAAGRPGRRWPAAELAAACGQVLADGGAAGR